MVGGDPGRFRSRVSAAISDADDEVTTVEYSAGEIGALIREYQGLRSVLEAPLATYGEPRLRRRAHVSTLCRLIDVDYGLQRVDGVEWLVLELVGMRDLSLRAVQRLLRVRHSTLQSRQKKGLDELARLVNERNDLRGVRRQLFWRRLFAWNFGPSTWLFGEEPVSFEVWARIAQADLHIAGRVIPTRALSGFGEGWLITPELIRRQDAAWDEEADYENVVEVPPGTPLLPPELLTELKDIWNGLTEGFGEGRSVQPRHT